MPIAAESRLCNHGVTRHRVVGFVERCRAFTRAAKNENRRSEPLVCACATIRQALFQKNTAAWHFVLDSPCCHALFCDSMSMRAIKAKASKKHRKTMMYFRPDQWNALIALAEETGAPITELVRRAVDSYLKERKQSKK